MRTTPIKTNFTAGTLSPLLHDRVDLEMYSNGCKTLENFIALPQGGIVRRGGFQCAGAAKGTGQVQLIPFTFSEDPAQSYILEFGEKYIRFWWTYNNGQIVEDDGVTAYEVVTQYEADDLAGIRYLQIHDVLYLFHGNYAPRKLVRYGHNDWRLSVVGFRNAPWNKNEAGLNYRLFNLKDYWAGNYPEPKTSSSLDNLFDDTVSGVEFIKEGLYEDGFGWSTHPSISISTGYTTAPSWFLYYNNVSNPNGQDLSLEITGKLNITVAGSYAFSVINGQFGDLRVDGTLIAFNGSNNGYIPSTTVYEAHGRSIELSVGEHTFVARMASRGNYYRTLGIAWIQPGESTYSVMPRSAFTDSTSDSDAELAKYSYYIVDEGTSLPIDNISLYSIHNNNTTLVSAGNHDDRLWWSAKSDYVYKDEPPSYIDSTDYFMWKVEGWIYLPAGVYSFAIDCSGRALFEIRNPASGFQTLLHSIAVYEGTSDMGDSDRDESFEYANYDSGAHTYFTNDTDRWFPYKIWYCFDPSFGDEPGVWVGYRNVETEETYSALSRYMLTPGGDAVNTTANYPRLGTYFQNRLWLTGRLNKPNTIYASVLEDVEDFKLGGNDADAMELTIASQTADPIQGLIQQSDLYALSAAGRYRIHGGGQPLTPSNRQVEAIPSDGASFIPPTYGLSSAFYVDTSSHRVMELQYEDQRAGVRARDLSQHAENLFAYGIEQIVFAEGSICTYGSTPLNILWTLSNGTLYGMTFDSFNKVFAWHKHTRNRGEILSLTVVQGSLSASYNLQTGSNLWCAWKDTDGTIYIEYMSPWAFLDNSTQAYQAGISGLSGTHLGDNDVMVRAGLTPGQVSYIESTTMDSGAITLDDSYSFIEAGYSFTPKAQTLSFEISTQQQGSTKGAMKRWRELFLGLYNAHGDIVVRRGENANLTETIFNSHTLSDASTDYNSLTGDQKVSLLGSSKDASIYIEQTSSRPLTIRSLYGMLEIKS